MQSAEVTPDTLYDVEFTFHSARNVPVADLPGFTADPFLECQLAVPGSDSEDNPPVFRSRTARNTLNPVWESKWRVAGMPSSGFKLTIRLRDEDPGSHDDRLGAVVVRENLVHETLFRDHQEYNVKKTRGSIRSYVLTYIASAVSKHISIHARLYLSIKVIGRTINQADRRVCTVGPHWWSVHYSPLIGRLAGTSGPGVPDKSDPSKIVTTFQANKLQLGGPVPAELRHHFVAYRPFIDSLFARKGVRGRIAHFGLRRQHSMIYYYSRTTEYGVIDNLDTGTGHVDQPNRVGQSSAQETKEESIQAQLARRFLDMTQWGEGGRLYTYVINLDGEWHFTESGPEFAIDMLSKHSMHSNVAPDVAFSGEFFVQRLSQNTSGAEFSHDTTDKKEFKGDRDKPQEETSNNVEHARGLDANSSAKPLARAHRNRDSGQSSSSAMGALCPSASSEVSEHISLDPKHYELVIDNNSGTYRPGEDLLPALEDWLAGPTCLGGLGKVRAMDLFSHELTRMKENRAQIKAEAKKRRGERHASASSNDVDDATRNA